jgi:uncharacterized secreted repeat protein (TIGR03808 family)
MPLDRRTMLSAGLVASVAAAAKAGPRADAATAGANASVAELRLIPDAGHDQSAALQAAIDEAASRGAPLLLPSGRFRVGTIELRPNTRIIATAQATTLEFQGGAAFLTGASADNVVLDGFTLDGAYKMLDPDRADGLVGLKESRNLVLRGLRVVRSSGNGVSLQGCGGIIADCTVSGAMQAGIRSVNASGLDIVHNSIADCANNGIQVWRSEAGEDGSTVANNRITRIRVDGGGSGENGNGVNVFRANGVLVAGNRISDCAYSAVRGNAASDIQIIANSCARLGEVALYAEFGFEGALIAANLVDGAATGVSVTNFNEGGRLAVVQGNLIRNLIRREKEPRDKRGEGITIEADAAITGNVIENAPTAGLVIGWGAYMRDIVATGNLIRGARVGILVSSDAGAGACLLANNMISGAADGAIRAMDAAGQPTGPELAGGESGNERISLSGNLAV